MSDDQRFSEHVKVDYPRMFANSKRRLEAY